MHSSGFRTLEGKDKLIETTLNKTMAFNHRAIISALIVMVLIANWLPQIDVRAQAYLTDTISSNAIVYGVVRTLNGVISVVQTAEIGVGIASIELGQIVDPINDLVERFSSLLLVTLTALGIANVLLLLTTSLVFKVLFTLVGIVTIALLYTETRWQNLALRLAVVAFLIRFLLIIQITLVWAFDWLYFDTTGQEALSVLQATVNVVESLKERITSISLSDLAFGNAGDFEAEDMSGGIANSVVTLSVGMLFKSILIPVGTIWLGLKLAVGVLFAR